MEQKLNITEILKNKALGTKLWSSLFGDVYFDSASANLVTVSHHKALAKFWRNAKLYDYDEAEPTLFPSKEMRDWSKFAWKKGDVLVSMEGSKILFDKWANEDYTKFLGKIKLLGDSHCYDTANYSLASKEEALEFIKSVEEINNGKLNLETLEIEKSEFKDGDIVCISGMGYLAYSIVKSINNSSKKLEYYVLNDMSTLKFEDWLSFEDKQIQPITETQQIILFDALAKKGKAWDAEKKMIVNLKPRVELKPFDKVLVRDGKDEIWEPAFFFRNLSQFNGYNYQTIGGEWRVYCVPYIGNESLLGTTKDVEG